MRSRKLLALIFSLLAIAPALAGYMTLLGAGVGSIQPVASWVSTTDPTFPSSSLTYSGPSLSTMFDSTGKLTYRPNNLLTHSNTFSNAAWVKSTMTVTSGVTDPLGGTNAFTLTATGPTSYIYQSVTGNASTTYMNTLWMKRRTGSGTVRLDKPDGATANAVTLTGSWQQFYVTGPGAAANAFQQILIATSGDAVDIYFGTLSAVTYETSPRTADQVITTSAAYYGPRIDYDPNTLAVKGLLIEEARTNQNKSSADIAGTGWTAGAGVTIGSPTTSPDGTSNAKLYQSTGAADGLYNTAAVAIASPFASSLYLKYGGTGRWFVIRSYGTGGAQLWVDLLNGVIGTSSNYSGIGTVITPTLTAVNNGWYRIALGTSAGATHNYLQINSVDSDNSTGQANGSAYVWGAQTEPGSSATSYIPTAAASVTRVADVVQLTGAALAVLQGANWSAFIEFADVQSYAGNPSLFDNSSNVQTVFMNGAKAAFFPTSLNTANNLSVAATHRVGVSATRTGGRSIVSDGSTVATDATAMTAPVNNYIGSNVGVGNFLGGHVRSLAFYNQRLSDATLQAKSVVGASYAANDNGVRFAFANDNLPVHWRIAL